MVSVWPLLLQSTKTFTKSLPSDAEITEHDILRVLHDPPTLTCLSPLVTKSEVLDPVSKPNLYTVHESPSFLGMRFNIIFTADYDGINVKVHAGFWTTLDTRWRVARNVETGLIEVSETVTCQSLSLLHPYVVNTMSKAHTRIFDRLVEKVKEDVTAKRCDSEVDGGEGK
ncbi:hypothetical protein BDP27DRAFT_746090 [Rhodocollybia butyracea]|uniref:DUF7053 domain-containing protein n=1 Tax=Rhodocollybia butyracea TaxID=206335 RepID=A0A9P5U7S8_9AGAR|nr:hypothetical protein BDP27DRAFT_746090 [Rhodocollybia butyracea]